MTDGAVWDVDSCLNAVSTASKNPKFDTRFYSLGIGHGCSESLVKGIAENGGGEYELVKNCPHYYYKRNDFTENTLNTYWCVDDCKTMNKFFDRNNKECFDSCNEITKYYECLIFTCA